MTNRERQPVNLSATRVDQEVLYLFSGEVVLMNITSKIILAGGQLITLKNADGGSPREVLIHAVDTEAAISNLFYP